MTTLLNRPTVDADRGESVPLYAGLRLTADEYLALPDDGFKYELLDGVVVISPSPIPQHQRLLFQISGQLFVYLSDHPVGEVFPETDVRFADRLVYRPELVFYRAERIPRPLPRLETVPDLLVEVLSPSTETLDQRTKRGDYERFGVGEYWIVDPRRQSVLFLRLRDRVFVEVKPDGDRFTSEAVPGFVLDLAALRRVFQF